MAEDHGHDEHGGGGGDEHAKGGHKPHASHGPGHGGGHEEHAGAPEWLISFADNTALLMGFFVILLAMNMAPKKSAGGQPGDGPGGTNDARMVDLIMGLREAFHNAPTATSNSQADRDLFNQYNKNREEKARNNKNGGVPGKFPDRQSTPNATKSTPNLTVEFDAGSATLSPASKALIAQLARDSLVGKRFVTEVRGHVSAMEAKQAERTLANAGNGTDASASLDEVVTPGPRGPAAPTVGSGAGYPLSYQRAYAVAAELARNGVEWRQLRIVACSDMERAVPRADTDPTLHRRNQRVEVIQSNDLIPQDPNSIEPGENPH